MAYNGSITSDELKVFAKEVAGKVKLPHDSFSRTETVDIKATPFKLLLAFLFGVFGGIFLLRFLWVWAILI